MRARADAPAKIRALDAYWTSLAGGDPPERAAVDLEQIKPLLPHLIIVEFEAEPFTVRYRLSGTKIDEWSGFNLAGLTLNAFITTDPTGASTQIMECYAQSWRTRQPYVGTYDWPSRSGNTLRVWFGIFPLAVAGVISQALAMEDYTEWPHDHDALPWVFPKP